MSIWMKNAGNSSKIRDAIRRELGIGSDRPVIVYSGKLIDRKRVDDLIRAVSLLSRERQPVELLIIGDGPCRARLTELARTLHVEVRFVGFQNPDTLAALLRVR